MNEYKQLYDQNPDFHLFVDRNCKMYGLTIEQALTHQTIRDVGDYYRKGGANGTGTTARPDIDIRPDDRAC